MQHGENKEDYATVVSIKKGKGNYKIPALAAGAVNCPVQRSPMAGGMPVTDDILPVAGSQWRAALQASPATAELLAPEGIPAVVHLWSHTLAGGTSGWLRWLGAGFRMLLVQ